MKFISAKTVTKPAMIKKNFQRIRMTNFQGIIKEPAEGPAY